MNDEALFAAVLRELAELLLDLGDLGRRVVLIGGQVLALESKQRGGSGLIEVTTETGVTLPRGFSLEPDLLLDLDEETFGAERLTEVLRVRGFERAREFRWRKRLPELGPNASIELDLFRRSDVAPTAVPTPMTSLPDSELVLNHLAQVRVPIDGRDVTLNVPDAVAFIAMKVRAKREQRPAATKDSFDLYAYVKLMGIAVVDAALGRAGAEGDVLRDALSELFFDARSPGVRDIVKYSGELNVAERALVEQDVIDTMADLARR